MQFIPHIVITPDQLKAVITLKDKVWPHGLSNQLQWMQANIGSEDIHGLFFYQQDIIAYVNLVSRTALIDGTVVPFLGLGNVCVDPSFQGTGKGKELMVFVNDYLTAHELVGILLCKSTLVEFYNKCGWTTITDYVKSQIPSHVQVMIFNYKYQVQSIEIKGASF